MNLKSPSQKTLIRACNARGTTQIADCSATHGPYQVRCPYAAGSGRLYSHTCFLPSGSGATVIRFFPRLAPPAASLQPKPETLSFKAFNGSLRSSRSIVNIFHLFFVRLSFSPTQATAHAALSRPFPGPRSAFSVPPDIKQSSCPKILRPPPAVPLPRRRCPLPA